MRLPVLSYQPMIIGGNDYATNHLKAFARDLREVSDAGFRIVPLRDAITAWLEGRGDELAKAVAFCLEDGSDFDFHDLPHPTAGPQRSALHALEDFRRERPAAAAHATSFAVISPQARAALDRACLAGRGWWSDDWWSEAVASGLMHVANHSWDHNHEMAPSALNAERGTFRSIDSRERADHEIRQAAEWLRLKADNPGAALFAYPYGQSNPYLANVYFPRYADELGIVAAFTDESGFVDDDRDRWLLPRFVFGRDWSQPSGLRAILEEATRPPKVFVEGRVAIDDPEDVGRYEHVPGILADWMGPHGGLEGREILDFGCGRGVTALALATKHAAARVVGVDIGPDPDRCAAFARSQLGMRRLPENLRLHRVHPGTLHDADDRFDFVYSWSVFEHVDQRVLSAVLQAIRECLEPDGYFLAQIAPLYYSSQGSHLHHRIGVPWAHLYMQHDVLHERLRTACVNPREAADLWGTYETLNRITANELVEHVRAAGFEIVRTHTTLEPAPPPAHLTAIFNEKILRTDQVLVLARRA